MDGNVAELFTGLRLFGWIDPCDRLFVLKACLQMVFESPSQLHQQFSFAPRFRRHSCKVRDSTMQLPSIITRSQNDETVEDRHSAWRTVACRDLNLVQR